MTLLRYIASLLRRRTTQAPRIVDDAPRPVSYTGEPSRWQIGPGDPRPVRETKRGSAAGLLIVGMLSIGLASCDVAPPLRSGQVGEKRYEPEERYSDTAVTWYGDPNTGMSYQVESVYEMIDDADFIVTIGAIDWTVGEWREQTWFIDSATWQGLRWGSWYYADDRATTDDPDREAS